MTWSMGVHELDQAWLMFFHSGGCVHPFFEREVRSARLIVIGEGPSLDEIARTTLET